MNDVELTEAANGTLTGDLTGKRWKVRLIEGNRLGSSGYYPAETLLRDGPKVFKKGTPMFLNHQTADEKAQRPFGSIQEFAGELAEDAYYDGDGLYAEIEVFEHEQSRIRSLKDRIGISIRAKARTEAGTIDGKNVPVVRELLEARSADFVMRAGAGGKLVQILESATESEDHSVTDKEGTVMDEATRELLEGLTSAVTAQGKSIADLVESLKPEEEVVESETFTINSLEVAKELAKADLSEGATERVLERFEANMGKKTLAELIESEKAYLGANKTAETEGVEESADEETTTKTEVEESAVPVPKAWATKKKVSN